MSTAMVISAAVAPVHKEAAFTSEMITQGLMFESVAILGEQGNWLNIKMEDGYEGWVHHFYVSENQVNSQNSLILTDRHTPLRLQRGKDSQIMALLSFGTAVPLIEKTSGYCKIQMINGEEAFIPAQHYIFEQNHSDIIKLATNLLGVPYIWGGKSSFGYDCSGFVQMVLKTAGISIERDSSQQAKDVKLEEISMNYASPGDLMFFSENDCINHVAFVMGEGKIIHCSGEVKIESIIEGEFEFNNKLAKLDNTFRSISNMVNS
jgi:SH3-like domain-containing protein